MLQSDVLFFLVLGVISAVTFPLYVRRLFSEKRTPLSPRLRWIWCITAGITPILGFLCTLPCLTVPGWDLIPAFGALYFGGGVLAAIFYGLSRGR